MAETILAGPGAARALASPGTGRVLVALGRGGYASLGDGIVAVVPPRAPFGPLSLVAAGAPRLTGGEDVVWDGRVLVIGGWSVRAGTVSVAGPAPPGPCGDGTRAAMAAVLAALPPPPPGVVDGITRLAAGDPWGAAAGIAGRGPGLTPAGDDVLAGWAAWRAWEGDHATAHALVTAAAARTTAVSAAYLRCAARGELPEAAHRVAAAARAGDAAAAVRRARGLAAWGATSGAALAWGLGAAALRVASTYRPAGS